MRNNINRNPGLDTLRSFAIISVFIHNFYYANPDIHFTFFTSSGWVGVDLFFTLSGYLIANQIITEYALNKKFSVMQFIVRRSLRILPNYLIIVTLYCIFVEFRDASNIPPLWKMLTFTTNIDLISGTGFSYSWSLCIEEQFYLMLSIFFIFCIKNKHIKLGVVIIIIMIAIGTCIRYYIWTQHIPTPIIDHHLNKQQFSIYQTQIYFFTFSRLDELCIGVLIALIKNYYTKVWGKFTEKSNILSICGIICCIVTFYIINNYNYLLLTTVFGYTMLGISFGMLVCAAAATKQPFIFKRKITLTTMIAELSYAIYLVEKPLNHIVVQIIHNHNLLPHSSIFTFFIATSTSILGAYILHQNIEKPFLRLRSVIYHQS